MAERPLNPASLRAPLQESKSHHHNLYGGLHRPSRMTLAAGTGLINKLGQENILTARTVSTTASSADLLFRKAGAGAGQTSGTGIYTTVPDDKDLQRSRIALQQKTSSGLNIANIKPHNVLLNPATNTQLKARQQPIDAAKSEHAAAAQVSRKTSVTPAQAQPQPAGGVDEYGSPEWIRNLVQTLPKYKFYFDGIDPSTAAKLTKVLKIYNAPVLKFFSGEATHIITTSPIPNDDAAASRSKSSNDRLQTQAQPSQHHEPAPSTPTPSSVTLAPGKIPLKAPIANAESSILVKAKAFGIKIWSLDRMIRLVKPLIGEPIAQHENRKLQDYLRHEKVYGLATTQKDDSSKADYYVFKGAYLLVEDTTGHYHTILAHEYSTEKTKSGRSPWPRIYMQATDKSPFAFYDDRARRKKRLETATMKGKDGETSAAEARAVQGADGQEDTEDAASKGVPRRSPFQLASGIINSVTSNMVSMTSNADKASAMHGISMAQGRVLEQLGKRVLNATKGEAGMAPDMKRPEFARPADVTRLSKPNMVRESLPRKREPLGTVNVNTASANITTSATGRPSQAPAPTLPASIASAVTPTLTEHGPFDAHAQQNAEPVTPAMAPVVFLTPREYHRKGYCENCRRQYDDFKQHIATSEHRRYAHDTTKFEGLDQLLVLLQRKPKVTNRIPEPGPSTVTGAAELHHMETVADDIAVDTIAPQLKKPPAPPPIVEQQRASQGSRELCSGDSSEQAARSKHVDMKDQHQPVVDSASKETLGDEKEKEKPVSEAAVDRDPELAFEIDVRVEDEAEQPEIEQEVKEIEKEGMGEIEQEEMDKVEQGEIDVIEQEVDEISKQLSSEMERLDVSETGEEEQQVQDDVEEQRCSVTAIVIEDPPTQSVIAPITVKAAALPDAAPIFSRAHNDSNLKPQMPIPFSDRTFVSETNLTSQQVDTDATQPDERFLGGYVGIEDSQATEATDPIAEPIQLALSMTSVDTDDVEVASGAFLRNIFKLREEGSSEGDRDGCDDAVALVKSPSAGRGAFARARGAIIGGAFAPVHGSPSSPLAATGSFKRKLENVLAEERAAERLRAVSLRGTVIDSPETPRPMLYDESLRSRLLSQSNLYHRSQQEHTPSWSPAVAPQHRHLHTLPPMPPSFSSPSPSPFEVPQTVNQTAIPALLSSYHRPSPFQQQQPSQTHASFASNDFSDSPHTESTALMGPTSPTSPMSHGQLGLSGPPRSPDIGSTYSGSRESSPPRSPSHRTFLQRTQTQFPVMSHEEQERERCYHHYRGNQLPEPAGQKKMRSSSSYDEAIEEYGEGCMVYIE